jgi:phage repressor protein C with HTH and peptisase S24 domain
MNEKTIGTQLAALRHRAGMSLADVAKAAGYAGPSSVQLYFSGDYDGPLQIGLAKRIGAALAGRGEPPIKPEEIWDLSEMSLLELDEDRRLRLIERHFLKNTTPARVNRQSSNAWDGVPILQAELSTNESFTDNNGKEFSIETAVYNFTDPVDQLVLPKELANDRFYIAFVADNSMDPRFRIGSPLLVRSVRPPSLGDDVVVLLRPNAEDYADEGKRGNVRVLIKALVGRNSASIELEQFNPHCRFSVPIDRVSTIHRVIPWHELLGL